MTQTAFRTRTRVQILDRDRTPANYPYATVLRACTRAEFFGGGFMAGDPIAGYVVRYDNGCEVWHPEYSVLAVRPIKARELRDGDFMRTTPAATTFVLVAAAVEVDGLVRVTIYSGDQPNPDGWTLAFDPDESILLRGRDLHPNERIA